MPVAITVSQVRQALYQAAGGSRALGDGAPSTAVLGQWFHDGLAFLVDNESGAGPLARLGEIDAKLDLWKDALVHDVYSQIVGPRLTKGLASLHESAPQVLAYWQAMQQACHWLAELAWGMRPERPSRRSPPPVPWLALSDWIATEVPLTCVLREPAWSDSVRLVGVADAIVRMSGTGAWCAIELKLGQTSPEADLGQACLYHLLISAAGERPEGAAADSHDAGTLALVSFRPERHERLFSAAELGTAKKRLINLIGELAGVDRASVAPAGASLAPADARLGPVIPSAPARVANPPTDAHMQLGRGLVATLAEYGVCVSLDHPAIAGPAFIRFPITLGRGTKVQAVERRAAELQVRLQLAAEPFISRDNGRLMIDVQRPDRITIWFDDIRAELPRAVGGFGGSLVPVGVDLFGHLVCADLARPEHAHLLVAGTTGSGKSEWLRLAVAGLIATNTPDTLCLVVIDPKRNAFHALRDSAFLWQPLVFPDEQPAADTLARLVAEMDRRYREFEGVDSFSQRVAKSAGPLPRIVCVCDEYRDLISRDRDERKQIEQHICRLGAKARAAGIHLILATQEPSRDTIKGPLDSNIPTRVGLKMGKSVESRMLLNQAGAEKLLGHGDLLFKSIGDPIRLQAPLLSDANRRELFGGG
ncbi:MAG: FtsK/SpoIIIE domain-containing protein [Planctomycetaceae bacterium]